MLTLILGSGMILGGLGLGAKNIWDAATERAFKNEKIMRKMVKNQKVQINELIEQNFDIMNNIKKNMDVIVDSTLELFDDVNEIQKNIENKMKQVNNKVCDFALGASATLDSIEKEDVKKVSKTDDVKKAKEDAAELLTEAMVDAGEDEELARLTAEAIREEEEAASQKRYKSQKKGGKK